MPAVSRLCHGLTVNKQWTFVLKVTRLRAIKACQIPSSFVSKLAPAIYITVGSTIIPHKTTIITTVKTTSIVSSIMFLPCLLA